MCTTYLPIEIIKRTGLDIIGYPGLVRLNPNIRFKTRGNGAVVLRLGHGMGARFPVGSSYGRTIYAYQSEDGTVEGDDILDIAGNVISEFAVLGDENTNPGLVLSETLLDESLYFEALGKTVSMKDAKDYLRKASARWKSFKLGRGIVGSSAALAWRGRRMTYELLSYRYPRPPDIPWEVQMDAADFVDRNFPETFNNIDRVNGSPAIFPRNRTPVVYGVRSTSPECLTGIEDDLKARFGVMGDSFLIYRTNQGTDDHIVSDPMEITEGGSYRLRGPVVSEPLARHGGHYFSSMLWNGRRVGLAAFEPTKQFRAIFRQLRPGDLIEVMGSMSRGNLKIEKMVIVSVSRFFRRKPPLCPDCGGAMKNHGRNDFRCRVCGNRTAAPLFEEESRQLQPGRYEVPVTARRHLSMPFSLENYFAGGNEAMGMRVER